MNTVIFEGFTVGDLFIQLLGFLGLLFSVISFQCRKHRTIMLFRTLDEFAFAIQYFFLGAYTGVAMNLIGCVRNELFAWQVKNEKSTMVSRVIFSVLFTVFSIATWGGFKSILVGIAKVVSTCAYGCRNKLAMRWMVLGTSVTWLIYNAAIGSVGGVLCESFSVVSIIVALIRIRNGKLEKEEKAAA